MSKELKKRFDRIVEILIQLQSKRVIKAKELSERFEVSLRTIYRDIKSIEQAGVPIIGEAGTGYSIMEGYKLPPVIFTKEEAMSFVTAEKLTQKFMDKSIADQFSSAMFKVKAVLRVHDKDSVQAIENHIVMNRAGYDIFNPEVPHALSTFLSSISTKRQVMLQYKGLADAVAQQRIVEPIGLFHEGGFWYIAAYCLKRQAYRQFRADRIHAITETTVSYTRQHLNIQAFLDEQSRQKTTIPVRIRISKEFARYLQWERIMQGYISEKETDAEIEMYFEVAHLERFARWYLMFADQASIEEPAELQEIVRGIVEDSLARLVQPIIPQQ